jgi:hypothetical protein
MGGYADRIHLAGSILLLGRNFCRFRCLPAGWDYDRSERQDLPRNGEMVVVAIASTFFPVTILLSNQEKGICLSNFITSRTFINMKPLVTLDFLWKFLSS